jgi:hypothetical protein
MKRLGFAYIRGPKKKQKHIIHFIDSPVLVENHGKSPLKWDNHRIG